VALHGPNGSGKTTVLRCVAGTLLPTAGRILVGGEPAASVGARRSMGTSLGQERSFYSQLSGRDNLLLFARLAARDGRQAARQVESVVEELALRDIVEQRAESCSAGMLQQFALARALLGDRPLLVLDEPARSLDELARERMWAALDRRPSSALLIATHSEMDLERCGRVIELPA
jgi:ABC-2 type transport system ATP-binding protein